MAGQPPENEPSLRVRTVNDLELVAHGPSVFAEDRRLFGVLADLTARAWEGQQLAEQAAQAQQLAETDRIRSALLAAVSHDLRTPLAGIKAAISSLRQQDIPWTEQEQDDLLATVEESADRLTALITNLLDMSRIQAGALSLQLQPVALDEVVGRALIGKAPNVEVDVPESLPLVLADAGLLERVVANLVDNALRYSPNGSPVEIEADMTSRPGSQRAGQGAPHARLRVKDHGLGIPRSQWDAVFAPFQRLGDQDSTTGIGLGLAIARGFTEAMDGHLGPSETAGGGLTMTVELPVVP
jgi:two-component system sensor histidine kinase KdpD